MRRIIVLQSAPLVRTGLSSFPAFFTRLSLNEIVIRFVLEKLHIETSLYGPTFNYSRVPSRVFDSAQD